MRSLPHGHINTTVYSDGPVQQVSAAVGGDSLSISDVTGGRAGGKAGDVSSDPPMFRARGPVRSAHRYKIPTRAVVPRTQRAEHDAHRDRGRAADIAHRAGGP